MAKKRANGEGTIRKRPDGLWEARVVVGTDPITGKIKRKSIYGKTQSEVRKKMTEVILIIDTDRYVDPSKTTVDEWISIWLQKYTSNMRPRSVDAFKSRHKNDIKPIIGHMFVKDVNSQILMELFEYLRVNFHRSASTIHLTYCLLNLVFGTLVDLGKLNANPCLKARKYLPKVTDPGLTKVTDQVLSTFLKAIAGTRDENICMVFLMTGMRRSELFGLQWDCVDFKNQSILIDKQLSAPLGGEKYHFVTTKNGKQRRIYPPRQVFEILKEEKRKQEENKIKVGNQWDEGDLPNLVFTDGKGKLVNPTTFYSRFKKTMKEAGLPNIRIHDLRHGYATLALESGVDVKTVQESLGHFSAAFTLDRYADVSMKMRDLSARKIEDRISEIQA